MNRISLDYVEDIADAMANARSFVEGMDYTGFAADARTHTAVVRAIEIMGEATKNVPPEIQDRFPDVPWREMAGMRDKVTHSYFRIRLEVVWDTVTVDIPGALPAVENCRRALLEEEASQA